jgi:hypothetical protein
VSAVDSLHPQLFDTSDLGTATKTEWPDVNAEIRPKYSGQMPATLRHPGRFKNPRAAEQLAESHFRQPHEQPLAMFHSAREIQAGWIPAEGDRQYLGTDVLVHGALKPRGMEHPRAGEMTYRPLTTHGQLNARWKNPVTGERFWKRTSERIYPPQETDEQMWQRKGAEAAEMPDVRSKRNLDVHIASGLVDPVHIAMGAIKAKKHPERTTSLLEHLRAGGEMKPIPLGHMRNPYKGIEEKRPMVAGGQHRISAMAHINPDQLLPVVHHENIAEARKDPGYA